MKRVAELVAFVALALGVHLAFALKLDPEDGAESGGQGGEGMVSIAAASASIETMVAQWERPPETVTEVAQRPDTPEPVVEPPRIAARAPELAPQRPGTVALPSAPPEALTLPDIDLSTPPEPEADPEPEPEPEPVAEPEPFPAPEEVAEAPFDDDGRPTVSRRQAERPADLKIPEPEPERTAQAAPKKQKASAQSQAQKSAGTGGSAQAGNAGRAQVASRNKAQVAQQMTVWGSQIRSRIERQKRPPRGARGKGRVVVRLTITRDGRVAGASVARSSGQQAFDTAALAAVSRAGRMPSAPAGLTDASYSFNLPIAFE